MAIISVKNLTVDYNTPEGTVHAVQDVSFEIEKGTITGIVGESGCGKSTMVGSLIRYLPQNAETSGEILVGDDDTLDMSRSELREIRWDRIAFIPQNAMNSLDPVYTIKEQMVETIDAHTSMNSQEAIERAKECLDIVDIGHDKLTAYPQDLSGGMKQRIVMAMSLLLEPDIIIADEPTTGLDMLVKDKILSDIEKYRDELGITVIIVSHDIADLVETSDQLMVMYGGKIVEKGASRDLFDQPTHPYTMGLKYSLPSLHKQNEDLITLEVDPPNLRSPPQGCRFVNRCPFKEQECTEAHPDFIEARNNIQSACYRADEWRDINDQASKEWDNKQITEPIDEG